MCSYVRAVGLKMKNISQHYLPKTQKKPCIHTFKPWALTISAIVVRSCKDIMLHENNTFESKISNLAQNKM